MASSFTNLRGPFAYGTGANAGANPVRMVGQITADGGGSDLTYKFPMQVVDVVYAQQNDALTFIKCEIDSTTKNQVTFSGMVADKLYKVIVEGFGC